MQYQFIPYIGLLLISAGILFFLYIYVFLKRRKAKGAMTFSLSLLILLIWLAGNAFEMSALDVNTKLFWANIQYVAYCYLPVSLLAVTLEFTGYDHWIRSKKILWLTVIPSIIFLLVWTDKFHGLIRYGFYIDNSGEFPVLGKRYGSIYYFHAVYSYALNISGWLLLLKAIYSKNTIYRKQATSLFVAICLIMIPNILYTFGFSPVKKIDITPAFFAPAGMIATIGIFRYKLFDVIPVAWAAVIKTTDIRVMVLDIQDRVLDINPAFEKLLVCTAAAACARPVCEVCSNFPELIHYFQDRSTTHTEFTKIEDGETKIYEIHVSDLINEKGVFIGRLAVAYDITKRKQEEQQYLKEQWKQAVMKEKEQHARNLHDSLGQILGFINLQAQGVQKELTDARVTMVSSQLDKLVYAAQSANAELREYIRKVRCDEEMDWNFIVTLKQFIEDFNKQTEIEVKLDTPPAFTGNDVSPNIRLNILNIIKEAMNNIRKHANAHHVTIQISLIADYLQIIIKDDGIGFISESYEYNTGKSKFGLNIMKERALESDGIIDIQSTPGMGSHITLSIPWKEMKH